MPNAKRVMAALAKVPVCQRIERWEQTEPLYAAEHITKEAVKEAAHALARVRGDSGDVYWTETLPSELFTVLESFQTDSSMAAAVGYLIYQSQRRPDLFKHYWPILKAGVGE